MINTPALQNCLLAISFPQGNTRGYSLAVALAKGANYYQESEVEGALIHVAGFARSIEGANRARAILDHIGRVQGCHISAGSQVWGADRVRVILQCYAGAIRCNNPLSFCQVPYESPAEVLRGMQPALLPCKRLQHYFIEHWHGIGSTHEQLQAAAIEAGVDWCPCFDPHNWQVIGYNRKQIA